eukprot:Platyproteum_vivax@DN3040_c0_g1_i1.p1
MSRQHSRLQSIQNEPKQLICDLCRLMYNLKWAVGTSGGVSIKENDLLYIAPSGAQKEKLYPRDIFVLDAAAGTVLQSPTGLSLSQCTPLFLLFYQICEAGCVFHFHSMSSMLATMIDESSDVLEFTHLEMIKGIAGLGYTDTLRIPILENTPTEGELTPYMRQCLVENPDIHVVLVRRHGVYVWGDDWIKAKTQAECVEYLLEAYVEMAKLGIKPNSKPKLPPNRKMDQFTKEEEFLRDKAKPIRIQIPSPASKNSTLGGKTFFKATR